MRVSADALERGTSGDRQHPRRHRLGLSTSPSRNPHQRGAILALQRAAGNAAVEVLLSGHRQRYPSASLPPSRIAIQRCGPVPCDCSSDEQGGAGTIGTPATQSTMSPVARQDGQRTTRHEDDRLTTQRFGSEEHVRIGNEALPGQGTLVTNFGRITPGEMTALGDYFSSVNEITILASIGSWGRDQISYALWKVNPSTPGNPSGRPNPGVAPTVVEAVDERYYRLAAHNEAHFSTGSRAQNNRERYVAGHTEAIRSAYFEGLSPLTVRASDWKAQEAFAAHFLEDAFSAGHVRTPRGEIQQYFEGLYPGFRENLVRTIACYMASYINDRDRVGYVKTVDGLTDDIAEQIRAQGGAMLSSFSIGDLVSKVMHDADNAGLDVVSAQGVAGTGPVHWHAVGDDFLFPRTPLAPGATDPAAQTRAMVERAVQLSWREGEAAHSAGLSGSSPLSSLVAPSTFSAIALIPSVDPASTANPSYAWRAPDIRSLPGNIQALINQAFQPGHEVRNGLDSMPIPTTVTKWGFTLHTGDAWNCFKRLLLADPLGMIVHMGSGNTCPSGKNNPCP